MTYSDASLVAHAISLQPAPARSASSGASKSAPLPLHLRLRPESGILPRGWLVELRTRYEEGPEGWVCVDRDLPEDNSAPKVLGWGIDRRAARAAAARRRWPAGDPQSGTPKGSNRDPSTLLVHPCTARLRQAVVAGGTQDVRTDIFEDVAYAEREAAPDTVVDAWLEEHGVFKAHGEACEGGIEDWDETICLVTAMAYAHLDAHPAVAMTSDGRLGWTKKAKVRGEAEGENGVAPLSGDLDEARAEVKGNLRATALTGISRRCCL